MHPVDRLLREMGIDGGGLGVFVSENLLDDPQIDAVFEQICGVAVAKRVYGDMFLDAAPAENSLESLLKTGGGEGTLSVLGGEKPGLRPANAPVGPEVLQGPLRKRYVAILSPLAVSHRN